MLVETPDNIVAGLEKLRLSICQYQSGKNRTCDCKYGGPDAKKHSESTGCPELRLVIRMLERMTQQEMLDILGREERPEPTVFQYPMTDESTVSTESDGDTHVATDEDLLKVCSEVFGDLLVDKDITQEPDIPYDALTDKIVDRVNNPPKLLKYEIPDPTTNILREVNPNFPRVGDVYVSSPYTDDDFNLWFSVFYIVRDFTADPQNNFVLCRVVELVMSLKDSCTITTVPQDGLNMVLKNKQVFLRKQFHRLYSFEAAPDIQRSTPQQHEVSKEQKLWTPTLCVDFDSTLHAYELWEGLEIADGEPVKDAMRFLDVATSIFHVAIFSCRSFSVVGRTAMHNWIRRELDAYCNGVYTDPEANVQRIMSRLQFPEHKPGAVLYIDDRGYQFNGDWSAVIEDMHKIASFKPWNKR